MKKHKLLPTCLVFTLLVLLLPSEASASLQPQYLVLVPSLLHSGTVEKGCVFLMNLNETVTVNAYLESIRENKSLGLDLVVEKDSFHCVTFTVPPNPSKEVMFLTIRVKGATHQFWKRSTVLVENKQSIALVQTDKPIYKPGQRVQFRVVSLDENFHPLDETVQLAYIQDPQGNRIGQWKELPLDTGLAQLSFPLSSEPLLGSYSIVVQMASGTSAKHFFTVEEFVLPKFEVQVTVPKVITILEEEVTILVCARYTYGKPVPGHASVSLCRRYSTPSPCFGQESQAFCEKFTQELQSDGCISRVIKTKAFQLRRMEYEMRLEAEAKVKEEGTDVQLTGKASSSITRTITRVSFVKVDSHFRPGIPFFAQVRLEDSKGVVMRNRTVFITASEANYHSNATTDKNGLAQFAINTNSIGGTQLTLRVKHKEHRACYSNYPWVNEEHDEAHYTASSVYSPSKSFVHMEPVAGRLPCGSTQQLQAHYTVNLGLRTQLKELLFYYMVMAKGSIVKAGEHKQPVNGDEDMKGKFSVPLPVSSELAPVARLLVFSILPDGEIIGDSAKYEVDYCLSNKVDLSFSARQSAPGSHAGLHVSASAQSLCGLRAVDQSVLLLKPEARLSPASVYERLPLKDLSGFPGALAQHDKDTDPCMNPPNIYLNGVYYAPQSNSDEKDMYMFLKDMGLRVFTNSKIHKPKVCVQTRDYDMHYARYPEPVAMAMQGGERSMLRGPAGPAMSRPDGPASPESPARTVFPETWIWELRRLGDSGEADVEVTVPDTITEWEASALCLSRDTGLGLAGPTLLRVFQPFFVEPTMPYSVIRGETFTLKATVFNYLPQCIRVQIQLQPSPDFVADLVGANQDPHCVCGNGRHTLSWTVVPKVLGNVNFTVSAEAVQSSELCGNEKPVVPEQGSKDTVVKPLLVEPEGLEREEVTNFLLCPTGAEISEQVSLKLPENVVEGSARAWVSVLGDILGSAMKNTQNLLQMPFGCGEQNMVLFAPNIYVLDYLNETQQLTKEIQDKALDYMRAGYQRQLNYRHHDGSFSTFGEHGGRTPGNTWLTAFVLKTLAQAQKHIFVDSGHITQMLVWLSNRQRDNGCFGSSGSLLNNAMKGGVDDEVTLSAYITIALLEMPLPVSHPVVRNALFCMETAKAATEPREGAEPPAASHVYTRALLAYAFALAGRTDARHADAAAQLLAGLRRDAVEEGDSLHWTRPQKPPAPAGLRYRPQAPSAEVELTAYVLLAQLAALAAPSARAAPSADAMATCTKIVKWLTKQQNSHGGFSSTQDTVVALQALARYGAATFTRSGKKVETKMQAPDFSTQLHVDDHNRLVLQQAALPLVPGEYGMTVSGQGCVYIQTCLRYNVRPVMEKRPFSLGVHTEPGTCKDLNTHSTFSVALNISYEGSRPSPNMVIADVKMLSGFSPLKATVKMLERLETVSRTEISGNHVLVYLEKMTKQPVSLSFQVTRDFPVENLKPAPVKVYDYYETDEFAVAEYNAPCSNVSENA